MSESTGYQLTTFRSRAAIKAIESIGLTVSSGRNSPNSPLIVHTVFEQDTGNVWLNRVTISKLEPFADGVTAANRFHEKRPH